MQSAEQSELYRLLFGLVAGLDGCPALERELSRSVDEEGRVLDEASPLLADLRRKQRSLQERIRDKLIVLPA
jgi:dsDNA-specific endonuclease/ATPase MutS2